MDTAEKTKLVRIAAVAAVCLLVAGCHTPNRQVTGRVFVDRGTVSNPARQAIWESPASTRGCEVTVTYRGTADCPARLQFFKPASAVGGSRAASQFTEPAGEQEITVKLRDITAIWLTSTNLPGKKPAGDSAYTIERVTSSPGARLLTTTTLPGATLTNVIAHAGKPEQTVWQSPVPKGGGKRACHVTLRLHGAGHPRAFLSYTTASGFKHEFTVNDRNELVTLANVVKIGVRCTGGKDAKCAVEIMQTDCPE